MTHTTTHTKTRRTRKIRTAGGTATRTTGRLRMLVGALALAGLALASPGPAAAQSDDRCGEQQDGEAGKQKNFRTVRGPDGRKIFVIERAFVVCGKVPKPQVIYVLQQRQINYEWESLKQKFIPKVLDTVESAPF